MADVRVSREGLDWLVWLEGEMVARFVVAGDALAYASLLECDPRARREASPA